MSVHHSLAFMISDAFETSMSKSLLLLLFLSALYLETQVRHHHTVLCKWSSQCVLTSRQARRDAAHGLWVCAALIIYSLNAAVRVGASFGGIFRRLSWLS